MKCEICEKNEATTTFRGVMVCEDCKEKELKAIKKDKEKLKNGR